MKNSILFMAVTVFMAVTIFTSCQSSAKKVENAQQNVKEEKGNVVEAKQELNQALKDSIQQFKKESAEKISDYDNSIAELKATIVKGKKETKAKYEKELAVLEQKNNDMKKKLDDYKEEGSDKWAIFKREFNHDMDELGKSLKGFTVKSK